MFNFQRSIFNVQVYSQVQVYLNTVRRPIAH